MTDPTKSTFARRIRAANPRTRKYDVWDDAISGLGLRVGTNGHRSFFLRRTVRGRIRSTRYSHSLVVCWRAVCEDARFGRLRLHDLRHTAASQAVMSGENLSLVGRWRPLTTEGFDEDFGVLFDFR